MNILITNRQRKHVSLKRHAWLKPVVAALFIICCLGVVGSMDYDEELAKTRRNCRNKRDGSYELILAGNDIVCITPEKISRTK